MPPDCALGGIAFLRQKEGESADDCQDAFACDMTSQVFALADGMTESFLPGEWAKALVRAFVETPPRNDERERWLGIARRNWQKRRSDLSSRADVFVRNRIRANEAAHATFIGASAVERSPELLQVALWSCGDACAFVFDKRGDLRRSVPLSQVADFGFCASSLSSNAIGTEANVRQELCSLKPGDSLVLATDALAKWILAAADRERSALAKFLEILEPIEFDHFISTRRRSKVLRLDNDDVTFVRLTVDHTIPKLEMNLPSRVAADVGLSAIDNERERRDATAPGPSFDERLAALESNMSAQRRQIQVAVTVALIAVLTALAGLPAVARLTTWARELFHLSFK